MRRPQSVVQLGGGPGVALREIERTQGSAAYVVDRQRVLHGTVHDDDLIAAQRRGDVDLRGVMRPIVGSEVHPDTPLSDLFASAAEAPLPLAVTDERGRLVGVVPRVRILQAMARPNGDGETTDDREPVAAASEGSRA